MSRTAPRPLQFAEVGLTEAQLRKLAALVVDLGWKRTLAFLRTTDATLQDLRTGRKLRASTVERIARKLDAT